MWHRKTERGGLHLSRGKAFSIRISKQEKTGESLFLQRMAISLCAGVAKKKKKKKKNGVPVVAQWLPSPTGNHEVAGLVPSPAQWVEDPVLP